MSKLIALTLMVTGLLLYTTPGTAQNNAKTIKEVRQAIKEFNQAFLVADVTVLAQKLTKQYVHSNNGSALINKKSWLNYIKKRRTQLDKGTLKVNSYTMSDLTIKAYHNSAVAHGVITSAGTRNNTPFKSVIRCTHFWVKTKGTWKRAAFHDSRLNK